MQANPMRGMRTPKRESHLPPVLSRDQMSQLIENVQRQRAEDPLNPRLLRLRLLLRFSTPPECVSPNSPAWTCRASTA